VEEVRITWNYQITIPTDTRNALYFKITESIVININDDWIIIQKPKRDITNISIKLDQHINSEYVEKVIKHAGGGIAK